MLRLLIWKMGASSTVTRGFTITPLWAHVPLPTTSLLSLSQHQPLPEVIFSAQSPA